MDLDIHTMENDLGSLFGSVKEEQKTSPEAPGKDDFSLLGKPL